MLRHWTLPRKRWEIFRFKFVRTSKRCQSVALCWRMFFPLTNIVIFPKTTFPQQGQLVGSIGEASFRTNLKHFVFGPS